MYQVQHSVPVYSAEACSGRNMESEACQKYKNRAIEFPCSVRTNVQSQRRVEIKSVHREGLTSAQFSNRNGYRVTKGNRPRNSEIQRIILTRYRHAVQKEQLSRDDNRPMKIRVDNEPSRFNDRLLTSLIGRPEAAAGIVSGSSRNASLGMVGYF